jgi:glycosyltransferase involved in cell wall biosynthesis
MLRGILSIPSIRRVVSLVRPLPPRTGFMCNVLSSEPFILHTKEHMEFDLLGRHLGRRPAHFLVSLTNSCENRLRIRLLRRLVGAHRAQFPEHHFIFMANSDRELTMLRQGGIRAEFCGSNCFVDERIFRIRTDIEPEFDAVYDGQLSPVKRHYLAAQVDRLALITYIQRGHDRRFAENMRRALAHAHWFNDPLDSSLSRILSIDEVAACYSRCRSGLCLSAIEGQMYASVQYLLCGLPVVTTRSKGGRDVFFASETARYVEENAASVRDGVREVLTRKASAEQIRQATLERMQQHRRRYIDIVQGIYDQSGVREDFAAKFANIFFDKMVKYHSRQELADLIDKGNVSKAELRSIA